MAFAFFFVLVFTLTVSVSVTMAIPIALHIVLLHYYGRITAVSRMMGVVRIFIPAFVFAIVFFYYGRRVLLDHYGSLCAGSSQSNHHQHSYQLFHMIV
jgi:hypothetical protein